MSYFLKDYNDELLDDVIYLSTIAEKEKKNFYRDNYTVSKILHHISDRFREGNGVFSIIYDNDKTIGYAGAYKHKDDPNVLICLVRAFILKQYRAKNILGNFVLPYQIKYAKENNYKYCWLTYNYHNKYIYDNAKQASAGIGRTIPNIYKQAKYYEEPLLVQNTQQYVIEIKV